MKKILSAYIVPPIAYLFIYLLSMTLRLTEVGKDIEQKLSGEDNPHILSFWHGRLFYFSYYYLATRSRWKVLTSPSVDGEIIARTLSFFGYGIVRGSTFKEARKALRELKRYTDNGYNTLLIADGSRGPVFNLQPGALMLSKLTGVPALPVAASFSKCWTLKTWDRMIIPKPFSKVVVIYGEPVSVPQNCDSITLEEKRCELESTLLSITKQADNYFNPTP